MVHPSINILWQEGAERDEKHLIFQSGALTQIDVCVFCYFTLREKLPVFVARSLCRSPRILDAPFTLSPPPNAHAPLLHSHNSAVTWQRGPSWTQHQPRCHGNGTHSAYTVNMLVFGSQRCMHRRKKKKLHICIQCYNINTKGVAPRSINVGMIYNLMHLQHLYICGYSKRKCGKIHLELYNTM